MPLPSLQRPSSYAVRFFERLSEASYSALFSLWASVIVFFALCYFALSFLPGNHSLTGFTEMTALMRFLNSLYFSVITSTTVGYGDLTPHGLARVAAAAESVLGFLILAIFVAKLVSFKSEIAQKQMHTLLFESKFYETREGLYTIRKDFDAVMQEVRQAKGLSDRGWQKMIVALWESHRLLEGIPSFYDDEHKLYMIDAKRERLLLESLERTLDRLSELLASFRDAKVSWSDRPYTAADLEQLIAITLDLLPLWERKSPHGNRERFAKLKGIAEELRITVSVHG